MKIVHIIPGSGGSFYCENCLRDEALVRQLRRQGHDVVMVPLYLPLSTERPLQREDEPVFYGAINLYLSERFSWYRKIPRWLRGWLDSRMILRWAATRSGSTRPEGLDEMTLSMLHGPAGRQARELDELVNWLDREGRPDIVHLSNALLLGLAGPLREALRATVFCTLQDEDSWVDSMPGDAPQRIWSLMAEKARAVDCFVAVSEYYAAWMTERLQLAAKQVRVIHPGIDASERVPAAVAPAPPVIGYLSRLASGLGLDILVEAVILLKRMPGFERLRLRATGGMTDDDEAFLERVQRRVAQAGIAEDVELIRSFDPLERFDFLRSLSVLSVPMVGGEAFGMFILESLSVGVPVVQPRVGGFPEIVEKTGGGILYEPNTAAMLAETLANLLGDAERLQDLGRAGRRNVLEAFDLKAVCNRTLQAYAEVLQQERNAPGDGGNHHG